MAGKLEIGGAAVKKDNLSRLDQRGCGPGKLFLCRGRHLFAHTIIGNRR